MKISISHLPIMIDMNYFINNTYIIKDVPEEYFVRGVSKRRIDEIAFFIDISGIDQARSIILQFWIKFGNYNIS